MKKIVLLLITIHLSLLSSTAQDLNGNWKVIASPFEGGSEEISFTATVSNDEKTLNCHADNFFSHASKAYPADWKMAIEKDGDKIRLGWMLDNEKPCSIEEFQEPANRYALFGKDADGNHRYIYFLSENIETSRLEAMTLWSDWQTSTTNAFSLPKTYQIYAVVSENMPYNGAVGYIDIWASVKVQKVDLTGILDVTHKTLDEQSYVDLQGRRHPQPQHGLFIKGGRKYIFR